MTYAASLLPEYDQEMASTRKVLERVPEDKLDWKPHAKSNTIGWNANQLAEIPGWVAGTLASPAWDIAPADGEPYQTPKLTTRAEILASFDKNVAEGRAALEKATDKQMEENWSLLRAGEPLMTLPRKTVMRSFVLNHSIHHRAVLCVYLRLNDIPVPGMYGPSGDEA